MEDPPARRQFRTYSLWYVHIDLAEVSTEEGKLYLFVAIDRVSKFAFAELHEQASAELQRIFCGRLSNACRIAFTRSQVSLEPSPAIVTTPRSEIDTLCDPDPDG